MSAEHVSKSSGLSSDLKVRMLKRLRMPTMPASCWEVLEGPDSNGKVAAKATAMQSEESRSQCV